MLTESSLYKSTYGAWAGRPDGHKPDYSRCCEEVGRDMGRWTSFGQCTRARGHGPDKAYCKQHDPDVAKARREKVAADQKAKYYADMKRAHGPSFLATLRKIADGHNDPRTLATEIVEAFDASYKP